MENKSNSLNRIKHQQREKVLRFSIRKYSFGAASVAVAALMFLGAHVVSADVVDAKNQPAIGAPNPKEEESPLLEPAPIAKNEETKETEKVEVAKETEEREKPSENKEAVEANPLTNGTSTSTITVTKDASGDEVTEKQTLDKSQLQASITNVQELLDKVNKEKAPASTLAAIQADLEAANSVLNNNSLELTQAEVDATAKKLNEKIFVLSSMPKANAPEKVVKEGKNTIANTGSHDSRNGKSMGQGTGERAATVSQNWTSEKNILSYQRFRASDGDGNTRNDDRQFVENKVDMTARIETSGGSKYVVYDVFFNNDGKTLADSGLRQAYRLLLQPKILDLAGSGAYNGDTIRDLHIDIYRKKNEHETGTLSQNPEKFNYERRLNYNFLDNGQHEQHGFVYLNTVGVRAGRPHAEDMKDVFKANRNDHLLEEAVKLEGKHSGFSYGLGLRTTDKTAAVHMYLKAKLRSGVTDEEVRQAFTVAVASNYAPTSHRSYAFVSGKEYREHVEPTVKQNSQYPIIGKEVIKEVGDSLEDNPVASGFVTLNDGSKKFPDHMSWSWPNGKPSTATAGVYKPQVKATYSDNSSNTTTATLKVIPHKPSIDPSSVNEKAGKTGQTVTVNVGKGVPDNSTVTLYSGNTVIGTGNTKGTTATITVSKALPSTAIRAKTTVKNTTVESEFSAPVTPTEVPDSVAPKVLFNGKELTTNADDTRFIVYRGANFNPTFKVQDDKNNVNLSITGLPKGVADVSKNGSKEFDYTIPENTVANDAPFGESTATVTATDGRNSATYKFKYRIVDLQAGNTTPENRAIGSELGDPHSHLKVADSATSDSDNYYPTGMQFKWKELDPRTLRPTDVPNTTKLNEIGNVTKYIPTAVFPGTVNKKTIDGVEYTIYTPTQKAVPKTFNVTDSIAPTVKLTNLIAKNETVLTNTVPTSTDGTDGTAITIFRGAKLVLPFKFSDNATEGRVNVQYVSGLPKGVSFGGANNKLTFTGANETNPATHTVEGKVAADATLGYSTVTLKVSDSKDGDVSKGNSSEVKFRVRVLDLDFEPGRVAEPNQSSTTINATKGQNLEDANNYLTVNSGTNRQDQNNFPGGMTFRMVDSTTNTVISKLPDAPGRHVVKARAYFPVDYAGTNEVSEVVTGNADTKLNGRRYMEKTINFVVKPTAPTITPLEKGDVTVTPVNEENVNRLNFTYKHPNGQTTMNVTATKTGNRWSLTNGAPADGVTINPDTGVVTIKDRAIKDATAITAKSVTTDSVDSDLTTENSKAGDKEPPKFEFTPNGVETKVENNEQVVYVTPTEETNLTIGRVTDNSGKLLESRIMEKNGNLSNGLGFRGLSYNELIRRDNTEVEAPRDVNVTGKVSEYKSGTTPWSDSDDYTRYVIAKDGSTNELRNILDGTNPTRVKFKILTQATKYDPQVSTQPINVDITAPGAKISQSDFDSMKSNITFASTRGPVKVDNSTKGLNIEMKEDGAIKPKGDGTYYVGATITYPDHSRDEIQIPVVKADANVPTATMDDLLLTDNEATTANFVVFKGSKFNPKFKVSDDKNKVTKLSVTGLPNGSTFEQTGDWTSGSKVQVTGDKYITTDTSTLGDHVGTVEVTDSTGNKGTYKYKYKVVDVEVINSPKTVELGTKLVDADNSNNGIDSHGFVKVVDTANASGDDKYYPAGMHFKWSKKNVQGTTDEVTTTTELNKPGVVTDYKALVKFPHGAGYYTTNIDGKTVKVYTPANIEKDVTFHVKEQKPAAPTISQWQNGNVKVTPPTDGDKVTIPLANGTVTLVKKDTGWELETPKAGLVFHNGSLEIPKDLVGTSITAKSTKGSGASAVDSDDASYTPKSHTVTKVDIVKEADSPLSRDDLSGTTGVTGVTDGTETKDFTTAKITSVVEKSPLPNVTPDSKHTIPVTITYEDGSTETTDVIVKVKPQAPTVTPKENGTVEITPILTGGGTATITYTGEDNTPQTVTVTKAGDGTWTSSDPTIAVDANGKVTIPADKVKDGSPITAQVTSELTGLPSQPAKATVGKPLEVAFGKPENAREKAKYTSKVVVTPNKSNSTITAPTVNGLTVNSEGKVTGTPDIKDWDRIEEHRDVTIKVTVTHEGDTPVTKDVIVNVLRDTDGDGDPDITDKDDDNDGIPDEEEKKNGTDPKAPTTQTPTIGITRKENGDAIVRPTKPGGGTYPSGTKVVIPGDNNTTIEVEIGNDGSGTVPNDKLPKGEVSGKGIVKEPNKEPSKPVNVTTPARKPSTVDLEQDSKTGDVTVTPKKPDGTKYPSGTKVEIPGKDKDHPITITIGEDGTGKVLNNDLPEGKTPGTGKITENGKTPEEVKVETPKRIDPILPETEAPTDIAITRKKNGDAIVTPKKPGGGIYPQGTKVEIPGEDGKTIEVTIGKDGSGEVPNDKLPKEAKPGRGTVTEPNKKPSRPVSVTTPARKTPTVELQQDPDTGEVTVTPKKPDGTLYPENTKVEIPGKDKDHPITVTIGKDGKGKVPNSELPEGKVPGTSKITVPGKPAVEVPVETPGKIIPGAPTTEQPVAIEINQKPNGDAVVTPKKQDGNPYPSGTKVEIPGEDKDGNPITITVTIGDNGSGEVPNDNLPKKAIPGTGTVTEPNKNPSKKVPVETPAHKTPKLELEQDPKTGDVTVTPKKPDGSTFPPKTKVEIPGENGPITVEIGQDGKGKVPNDKLPKKAVPGTGKITVPGKPTEEVPVETPAHKTPTLDVEQDPKTGDVTVTPKKPDGSPFPRGTKVEIPGKDKDHPITVTIGEEGKGKVPNSELPEGKVPGKGKITEPGKPTEEVPVETPAHKTPTLDVEQDPKTGDVTVTPKKPDGSPFPRGTKVEIPGEEGPITVEIGQDGKGKVPNNKLPKKDVPGTAKITEPGKPAVEVPNVTTPAHKTPTLDVEQDPKTGDVTVTPKKPDGSPFPSGTKVEIPGKDKDHPITVTIDEEGKGKVPNSELPEGKVPGKGKITEPGKPTEEVPVETPAHKTPTLDVEQDPKTGDVTVTPKKPDGSPFPRGTKVEIPGEEGPITVEIGQDGKGKVPNNKLPKKDVPGTAKITEPGKPAVEVPNVTTPGKFTPETPVTEKPGEIGITQQPNGNAIVTPKKPDGSTYPPGTKVEIPGENGTTITVTIGDNGSGEVPNDKLPKGNVPGKGTVTEPNKKPSQPVDVTTPARKTPTVELEQDPKTGDVIVTPKKPDGTPYESGTKVEIPGKDKDHPITVTIGEDGKGKVPNSELPDGKVPGTAKITEPGRPTEEVPVETPAHKTPTLDVEQNPKTGEVTVTPKRPDGTPYPPGTTVEIPGENGPITVEIGQDGKGKVPNNKLPKKDVPGTGKITEPGKPAVEVPNVTTPAHKTPTLDVERDPKTGDVTVTPKRPDGSTYPPGTKVEIPGENGPITVEIGQDGKGKVPNGKLPKKDVPGTGKITEPGKPAVEVPNVTTPGKFTPETPVTEQPGKIEITQQPNGNAIVTPKKPDGTTYPPGTKVEIPGENGTTITVTIGDNGSGEVPNDKLPKGNVPGKGTVTEPNKKPSQPVDVTTPARKTPTLDVERDPETGDVTVTPKKPDGTTYPPGTTVEIPGKDGKPITVTIGEDGKGKVPNSDLPDVETPGTAKITEPGQPTVEVPNVTTPGKFTPETPVTEQPGKIEITQQPNGNAIVTPKKPDGTTYPPGTKVEIPGENGTTITVTIGDNGSGEVPNDKLPKGNVPGKGTVTEPNKKPSQPVDVTTPARKTPTLDVERDPETGDVTVTPKKPDGTTYPPGTTVEIPGKDGKPITVTIGEDGKGKVPNSDLPDVETPGTAKITEPGQPTVEVPNVTTPGKFTPETPVTEQPGKIEITQQPNGNAIVTPKKPDGTTYPPGTKVEIPGENGTTITVTIGDNGSGEVPNDKLPKGNVPGKGTVTEPNKKPSQPVDVTTPARKTPTLDVERDPETGDVTVTPKKPDGTTYPPGTTVEIPGKDGKPITVTIGEDGKGKVPNSDLPDVETPGTAKITEPGQPTVEVPNVTTPGKFTPETPTDTNPVAPVTPDTNGDSGQDKPAPATPTPNADPVDTKTTNDNGAKSNDSQNVLPNTGTESNAALASLGLLGLLSGFGLVARKKKED